MNITALGDYPYYQTFQYDHYPIIYQNINDQWLKNQPSDHHNCRLENHLGCRLGQHGQGVQDAGSKREGTLTIASMRMRYHSIWQKLDSTFAKVERVWNLDLATVSYLSKLFLPLQIWEGNDNLLNIQILSSKNKLCWYSDKEDDHEALLSIKKNMRAYMLLTWTRCQMTREKGKTMEKADQRRYSLIWQAGFDLYVHL